MIKILQYSSQPSMEERDGKLVVSSGACTPLLDDIDVFTPEDATGSPTSDEEYVVEDEGTNVTEPEGEEEASLEKDDPEEEVGTVPEQDTADTASSSLSSRIGSVTYAAGAAAFVSMLDGGLAAASIAGLAAWSLPRAAAQEGSACEQGKGSPVRLHVNNIVSNGAFLADSFTNTQLIVSCFASG